MKYEHYLLSGALLLFFVGLSFTQKLCPGCVDECIGNGVCCSQNINGTTYCSVYCLEEDYVCCGCDLRDGFAFCGGCHKDDECKMATQEKIDQGSVSWYCAEGSTIQSTLIIWIELFMDKISF